MRTRKVFGRNPDRCTRGIGFPPARGFTMVETLVALVVLSIGLLGIAALYLDSLRAGRTALNRTTAIQRSFRECREAARDFAEELVVRQVLDPEEWWAASLEYKEDTSSRTRGWISRWIPRGRKGKDKKGP